MPDKENAEGYQDVKIVPQRNGGDAHQNRDYDASPERRKE